MDCSFFVICIQYIYPLSRKQMNENQFFIALFYLELYVERTFYVTHFFYSRITLNNVEKWE